MNTTPEANLQARIRSGHDDRRSSPRYEIAWPATIETREAPAQSVEIQNISEGGARVHGSSGLSIGIRALLNIEGLALLVPCVVVGQHDGDIRVQFEMEGLGKREFSATTVPNSRICDPIGRCDTKTIHCRVLPKLRCVQLLDRKSNRCKDQEPWPNALKTQLKGYDTAPVRLRSIRRKHAPDRHDRAR